MLIGGVGLMKYGMSKWSVIAGVDGCPGGWLAVSLNPDQEVSGEIYPDAAELLARFGPSALIAIDIPIGLPNLGARACDIEARKKLGRPRMSSVFPAPLRCCLAAKTYEEASELRFSAEGKKLSRQTFGILAKVEQIDTQLRADKALAARLIEVHPEVCFSEWNGKTPMQDNKRKVAGKDERLALIEREWPGAVERLRNKFRGLHYAADDLHDAFAALWTARRFVRGEARTLGPDNERDDCGFPMRIVV